MAIVVKQIGPGVEIRYHDVPLFDKIRARATIAKIATSHIALALQDLAGFISDESPVGVTGNLAQSWGANPATATGGIEMFSAELESLSGRVFSSLPYAIVMDQGREPGARMPPVDAIALWAERVLGLDSDEAQDAAWAIAKAIQKRGIKGREFIDKAVTRALPRIEGVIEIMGEAIAIALVEPEGGA